jgi:hypothetical protein
MGAGGFRAPKVRRFVPAMGIAWFDDDPPPPLARELRSGGLPLLPSRTEWPACPRCSLPLLFRAQVPVALTSLAPFDDERLILVFECHAETDEGACAGGLALVVEGELEVRTPPIAPLCDVLIDDPGPTPSRLLEVLRMLEAKMPFDYPFTALRTVPASLAEQALVAIREAGAEARAKAAPPTTLAPARGGKLAPFEDGFVGTRRTTLPPLRELMSEKRTMVGIFGGATPGYRDHALVCACGAQTRTAFRLLADESSEPALGPAALQLCPRCSHAELLRMGATRLRATG